MRKTGDRIRHALSFEIIGLALITPLGAWLFAMPPLEIGVVGLVSATLATLWNYVFNLAFDHALQRRTGSSRKTLRVRVFHAVLFETTLLVVLLPFIAWYLGISLLRALLLDASFVVFYLVYTFVFNWAYDRLFPLPEWQRERPH